MAANRQGVARRAAPLCALLVLVASLLLPAPAAAATADRCAARGSRTIVANEVARVFLVRSRSATVEGGPVYGCWLRSGRRVRLGVEDLEPPGHQLRHWRLAGRHVAFAASYFRSRYDTSDPMTTVKVVDLQRRTTRRRLAFRGGAFDLVLSRAGAVAWIDGRTECPTFDTCVDRRRVQKIDATGHQVVDEDGRPGTPTIQTDSLALARGTLYWTKGEAPRAARLYDSRPPPGS